MFVTLHKNFIRRPPLEMKIIEPTDDIVLFGKTYRMYHDDWKHHVHLKCTNYCDAKCDFCIERPSRYQNDNPDRFMDSARRLIKQLKDQGHFRTLSVTGGEPTEFPRLQEIVDLANEVKPTLFSINSNGRRMNSAIAEGTFHGWLDLSKHAINDSNVMHRCYNVYPKDIQEFKRRQPGAKVRIQCVLGVNNGLYSLDEISDFIWHFAPVADNFSFRSLIVDDEEGEVPQLFWDLRDSLFDAGCCKEQSIQDYYVYEVYGRNGVEITVSWANMHLLRRFNETHQDENFLEEIIVHPDGMITGSWNKRTLVIHDGSPDHIMDGDEYDDGCYFAPDAKCRKCQWYGNGCRHGRGPNQDPFAPRVSDGCSSGC